MLVSGGRLAAALMALVTIRAVTTFLTPEQYGALALLIAVQTFCGFFLVNPVGQHINLHTHAWWDDGTLMARLKSYRRYIFAVSLVGCVVVIGMGRHLSVEQVLWSAVAMFVMVVAGTWNATLISLLNMVGFRAASILWTIITGAVGLVGSILLCIWFPSAIAWFAGQALGMTAGALGARYVLRKQATQLNFSQTALPLLDRNAILTYCLPLALATGLMWLQLSGYRCLIEVYWGLAQLGLVAIGLNLAGQVWSLAESLAMQFLNPLFYRRISEHENLVEVELAFSDLLNTLVPVYFVLAGSLVLGAPYLLKILVAPKFQDAIVFVMLGSGIELCRVLGNILSNAAHARRKTISLALPYAAGAIVSLVLIYIVAVCQMGVMWAGAALIIGAMAMLMVMWFGMRRQVNFKIDFARWAWGLAFIFAVPAFVTWIPKVSGMGIAIAMLVLVAIPSGVAMLTLLWKNPAMLRLLNVQLRNN